MLTGETKDISKHMFFEPLTFESNLWQIKLQALWSPKAIEKLKLSSDKLKKYVFSSDEFQSTNFL